MAASLLQALPDSVSAQDSLQVGLPQNHGAPLGLGSGPHHPYSEKNTLGNEPGSTKNGQGRSIVAFEERYLSQLPPEIRGVRSLYVFGGAAGQGGGDNQMIIYCE